SIEGGLNVPLTVRLLSEKEVGGIMGEKGDSVKKMCEESGVRIHISEGNCPERIITLTGPTKAIFKAFAMVIDKLGEDVSSSVTNSTAANRPPCGSLIGKGGCEIKEIGDRTGTQVQVTGDVLCNSTERAITTVAFHNPSLILHGHGGVPSKGMVIPYQPRPSRSPVIFAGGQAYTIQGKYAIPQPDLTKLHQLAMQQFHFPMTHGNWIQWHWIQLSSGLDASAQTTSHELTIPNDLIGCIIGCQDVQISVICQMSRAQIKIANLVEGSTDRQVTIHH
ncbi:hypothetical protein U0070_000514, partial [Myodes glareolus]